MIDDRILWMALGAVFTIVVNVVIDFYKDYLVKKHLSLAFAGEIQAILTIVEFRKFPEHLEKGIQHMRNTKQSLPFHIIVKRNYFNVYESNVHNIGILHGNLPEKIATFYTQCNSILEDTTKEDNISCEEVEELLKLFQKTIVLGNEIIEDIKIKYKSSFITKFYKGIIRTYQRV